MKLLLAALLISIGLLIQAQEPIVEKGFLILQSTRDYEEALKTAEAACEKLDLELDLRGYYASDSSGLATDEICGCGMNHGYVARGRFDDGNFISIEYTDSYNAFAKGYYIVVAASWSKEHQDLKSTLDAAKQHYADAYVKQSEIYMGCMH